MPKASWKLSWLNLLISQISFFHPTNTNKLYKQFMLLLFAATASCPNAIPPSLAGTLL